MGLPWIELHTNLPRHRKSIRLGIELKDKRAWAYMAQLWLWCAENNPDGVFEGHDCAVIAEAAGWEGDPAVFIDAAAKAGFLSACPNGWVCHGWSERAAAHVAKLERDAARQRERYAKISKRFAEKKEVSEVSPPENARRKDGPHADVAGNSNSNPNPNPNPSFPSEKKEAPPVPQKSSGYVLKYDPPTAARDAWLGVDFFAWAQSLRVQNGFAPEDPYDERQLSGWWNKCLMSGATVDDMCRGFLAFGRDSFWEGKGFLFRHFAKHWAEFTKLEGEHHAA